MITVGLRRTAAMLAIAAGVMVGCDQPVTAPLPQIGVKSSNTVVATGSAPKIRAGVDQVCEWYSAAGTIQCQKMWNYGLGQYGGNDFHQYVATYTDPNIVNLVVGPYSVCVLLNTGNTKCWGESASAIEYTGGDAIAVSLSRASACVVTRDGTVKCRSDTNAYGIYGSPLDSWTVEYGPSGVDPTKGNPIPYTGKALWIVSGGQFHCFQTAGNSDPSTLSCIGSTYAYQNGALDQNDYPTYRFNGTPVPVSSGSSYNICVLMAQGNVDCLPIYYNDNGYVSGPKSAGNVGATDLSGSGSTCALIPGGDIECWGSGFNYQYLVGYNTPYTVSGRNAVAIARSGGDLCWLDIVGSVSCLRTNGGQVIATAPAVTTPRDATPPVITPAVSGTPGANGWYTSDVTVSWSVTDAESQATSSGCGTVVVSSDIAGSTITCSATSDGGTASRSVTVKRDATNPLVAFSGGAGSYTVDQNVAITCAASDNLSGLASTTGCTAITGAAYTFAVGTNSYSATATDNAGNGATASRSFTVSVGGDGVCALIDRFVSQKGVANSMCVKVRHQSWGALKNELSAQSGKFISASNAAIVARLVDVLSAQ